jgi:DNA-binding response OmpR family regulator
VSTPGSPKREQTVWVIDCDLTYGAWLCAILARAGFRAVLYPEIVTALADLRQTPGPDLWLVNENIPDEDADAFIQRVREVSNAPVLVLTEPRRFSALIGGRNANSLPIPRTPEAARTHPDEVCQRVRDILENARASG